MKVPPRDVKKALDLLAADPARAWTVSTLASACGVSRRTLQRNFHGFVGRSPVAMLRMIRLDRARQQLMASPPGATITSIAAQCGFGHFGRFAAMYRARHGETPSATLQHAQCRTTRPTSPVLAPTSRRPTLAVLPFDAAGPGVRGAAELRAGIVAAIRRRTWADVLPPPKARYHLGARLQSDGMRQRMTLTLTDMLSGRLVWADKLDVGVAVLPRAEDRVADRISGVLESMARRLVFDPIWRQDPVRLDDWLAIRAMLATLAVEPTDRDLELLERAIETAPQDPLPLALASYWHGVRGGQYRIGHAARERKIASALATRAAAIDSGDSLAETALAAGYTLAHDLHGAMKHAERALALDGGSAWAWGRSGWVHLYNAAPREAIERFQIARILSPADPLMFLLLTGIGIAYFQLGNYAEAARWCRRGLDAQPQALWINRFLAPCHALAGQWDDARRRFADHRRSFPDLTIAQVKIAVPPRARLFDPLAEGLGILGMPVS